MADNDVKIKITAEDVFSEVFAAAQKALQQMAIDGKQATDRLQQSFSRLNIKSQLNIETEKARLVDSFNQIKNSGVASANEIRRAQESMNLQLSELDKQLRGVAGSVKAAGDGSEHAAKGFASIKSIIGPLAAAIGAMSLVDLARSSVEAAVKMQALDVQFKTISGSTQMAAANLKFVRDESQRLGLVFEDTAGSFAKFAASSRGTSLAGDSMRKGFTAVSEAVTAMHLPAEAASRTFAQLSQMMGKGKITAEDMNVIVEAGVVSYSDLAKSMNMTIPEFRSMMQNGEALSNEILPKLFDLLHDTFGEAAKEGAKSAQAQFNLFKNTMFEVGAVIGQTVLPVVNFFMQRIGELANGIKAVVDWLGPFGPALAATATAMTLAATATTAFSAATAIAELQTTKLTLALLRNPLVIGAALFVGAIVAIKEVIDWFFRVEDAQKKAGDEAIKAAEKEKQAASEKMKMLEEYESSFGVSLQRRLQKLEAHYKKELKAAEDKARMDREAAQGNAAKLSQIEDQLLKDRMTALNKFDQEKNKARDEELKSDNAAYNQELKNALEFYKAKNDLGMQHLVERKLELQKELEIIDKFYSDQLNAARGNVVAELAIEGARNKAIEEARKRSLDSIKIQSAQNMVEEVDRRKQTLEAEIVLIRKAAADRQITERQAERLITALTVAAARDQYEARRSLADKIAKLHGKNGEDYKKALKDQESSHNAYVAANLAAYKKYSDEIKSLDQQIADFRLSIQQKIADLLQRGMTDSQKYNDNEKRYAEAVSKSKEFMARGDFESAKKYQDMALDLAMRQSEKKVGIVTDEEKRIKVLRDKSNAHAIMGDYEQSLKYASMADELVNKLGDTTYKESEKVKELIKDLEKQSLTAIEFAKKKNELIAEDKANSEAIMNVTSKLNEVSALGVSIMEAKKKESADALAKLKEIQNMPLDPKNLQINLDESALARTRSTMSELTKTETKTIVIRTVSGDSISSHSKGYFSGGKVASGSPLRDSVNAVLAKNEWVINNKATGVWGDGVMSAINNPLSAAGRLLQERINAPSLAGAGSGGQDMGVIKLQVGDSLYPMQGKVNVLQELSTAVRRMRKAGVQ